MDLSASVWLRTSYESSRNSDDDDDEGSVTGLRMTGHTQTSDSLSDDGDGGARDVGLTNVQAQLGENESTRDVRQDEGTRRSTPSEHISTQGILRSHFYRDRVSTFASFQGRDTVFRRSS